MPKGSSRRLVVWILLLVASGSQVATTPLDQWRGFTLLSLIAAAGALAALIYEIIKWNKAKEGS
jgi:hypothetical protein